MCHDGHASPPTSPAVTSTTLGLDSRPSSVGPAESTPTFEEIYDVPVVDLAPRETERTSILERFPMEIFMRIMLHCDWKQQIRLRRCNSNIYDMVNLDAIPWETKTAILLHEENYNPKNFPKKESRRQEDHGPGEQDLDTTLSSDDEGSLSSKAGKGRGNRGKVKSRAKDKNRQEDQDRFACYSCFKILPAYYFEGRNLELKATRTGTTQKKRGHNNNNQTDKKVDTRVEYVQVISVNPGTTPEWLVKDKAEVSRTTDVESYVRERMKRGVKCDDLRRHYKDITSGTHCVAPIRGVNPFFTASPSPTPPRCETHRPVYQVDASHGPGAGGVDNSGYTYEICIPQSSARDESPMGRPRVAPATRICQPTSSVAGGGFPAPAPPQVKEIIALRRFCILCGAKYGAYRRDDNRKIISKTEEGWWVCVCRKVRQTGVGRSCPDCGKTVIY